MTSFYNPDSPNLSPMHLPLTHAVACARALLEDCDFSNPLNREYARGIVELLADLFPISGQYMFEHKQIITKLLGIPDEAVS